MPRGTRADLQALKQLLKDFADDCADKPRQRVSDEFSDLLSYLLELSDSLQVDLRSSYLRQAQRRDRSKPD